MATKRTPSKATAKPAVKKAARLPAAEIAKIDTMVQNAKGSPGYPMVRALGKLAKLGPYPAFKKLSAQ